MITVSNINPGNEALRFIDSRINDENYRGSHVSQHNRYEMGQVLKILTLLDKYVPDHELMTIRTTDISKRPENLPEEYKYAEFCNEAKGNVGIGSQDAMRKNLFVDFHRMGLIERFDESKNRIDPYGRKRVKYVALSNQGRKLITAETILDQYFIFSKAIDKLLGGQIDILLELLMNRKNKIGNISIYEYMFFVSAVGSGFSFGINLSEAIKLIISFKNLTKLQRRAVVETLKSELNPKNFLGSKKQKRDFHNWHNEAQQVYQLLNQTVYFEVREGQLVIKTGKNSFDEVEDRLDRSLNEKSQYFVNHEVGKITGFELHHVIPLAWSESAYHFKILDKWKNMVYIDAFSHAKITQNNNRNVVMSFYNNDLILADYSENQVYLKYKENISYNPGYQKTIDNYNSDLLNTIG